MSKNIVFTDIDLDGAGCYLLYKLAFPEKEVVLVNLKVSNLREKFLKWLNTNSLKDYSEIYFFDIDTTSIADLIDLDNVNIVDHHKSHVYKYKNATANIVYTTSCVKVIYNIFKDNLNLTNKQLNLIALINDYDCYELKFENSYNLNILFWYYTSNRTLKFYERFKDGFNGFTKQEKFLLSSYKNKFKNYYSSLRMYTADILIGNKSYNFISTFVDNYINDIAHKIITDNNKCDIVLLINATSKRVYLRTRKNIDIDISKFAEVMCDGGGHKESAGGFLTEKIQILSKQFQPL